MLGNDIVLDEEAFEAAANGFEAISDKMKQLRQEVENMINTLKSGFDTPAGAKFINSCEKNLYKPIDDQRLVIEHIKETLLSSKQQYETVFDEYSALQSMINNIQNN